MPITSTTATLLAQGAAGRKLVSCNNPDAIGTCFANLEAGGDIDLVPGTMSSGDGISSYAQLSLQYKHASIACSEDEGACVWQGVTGKRVVDIYNNGGTTTLGSITIKEGDAAGDGGGLYVLNSIVDLILVAFIDNAAGSWGGAICLDNSGSSTLTLQGCSFAGNTAGEIGPDVYNNAKNVVISGWCPEGEDKPIRPSPPFVPSLH